MADQQQSAPGLGDLFAMFGSTNPLASVSKSIEQFKRAVGELLKTVETFNTTMESLNGATTRLNSLLDEVEQPIRALMPQMTRSIKTADAVITQISGPVQKVAPGLARLADALNSPVVSRMPADLGAFLDTMNDLSRRLQPLTQVADTAAMFGLRPLAALRGATSRAPSSAPVIPAAAEPAAPAAPSPARHPAAHKAPAAKKPAAKKPAAKKAATKKTTKATKRTTKAPKAKNPPPAD